MIIVISSAYMPNEWACLQTHLCRNERDGLKIVYYLRIVISNLFDIQDRYRQSRDYRDYDKFYRYR